MIKEYARAKLNLSLHVTGFLDDGYHTLDSVVVFAESCDLIEVSKAAKTSLDVVGPMSVGIPTGPENLILRAAALFPATCTTKITLHKYLPAAAGIGGGSADAAATLRAFARLWDLPLPAVADQLGLGADVPACMTPQPKRMAGVGDELTLIPDLPEMGLVLVNPKKSVPTGDVFQALESKNGLPMTDIPCQPSALEFADWLSNQRNDLQAPAIKYCPDIELVLKRLSVFDPLLVRMSGSGATCFALFDDPALAKIAAQKVKSSHPHWWVDEGCMLTG